MRIDTVHQGDWDGVKGVYHITCVDAVSQRQVEACVQGISEAFLLPVPALILAQFPFVVLGFRSDNGSEYINHQVTKFLEKLRTAVVSPKGKIVKRYQHEEVKTPLECLAQWCEKERVQLNLDITLQALQTLARSPSDLAATQAMQQAKRDLFASFEKPKRRA